jgi:pimeloyl-ACP methyl ester carboxylesterase
VAATRRALDAVDGPTVLVGHSYAGSVISEAGTDPRVVGLVYVAARAPDAGEDFAALTTRFPTMPVRAGVVTRDGMSTLSQDAFLAHFANGLPLAQARQLHAVQQPIAADLFSHRTTSAAWRSKPSWYAVSADDQTTSPALQRYLAQRMGATVLEVDAGHLSPLSHPQEIASLILSAAQGVGPAPDSVHPAHR